MFSRALLSVSMIVMLVNALHPGRLRDIWKSADHRFFLFSCLAFLGSYLISGLWSADKQEWMNFMQIKLPFLFLPFALLSLPLDHARLRQILINGILLLLTIGMLYSFHVFLQDPAYLKSNVHLPSPMEGDYIRFTMVLVFAIHLVLFELYFKQSERRTRAGVFVLVLWALFAIFYIHFQAAKSGLVCFYIMIASFLLSYFTGKRKLTGILVLAAIVGGALWSMFNVPLMRKQVDLMMREKQMWEQHDTTRFTSANSFVPRLISYDLALGVIADHPLLGVGGGDLEKEMDRAYTAHYDYIPVHILPHNQFLCTAMVVGIPLTLTLVLMILSPLKYKRDFFSISVFLVMLTGLMIEPMLETQYGIFVYLFFTMFWIRMPLPAKHDTAPPVA